MSTAYRRANYASLSFEPRDEALKICCISALYGICVRHLTQITARRVTSATDAGRKFVWPHCGHFAVVESMRTFMAASSASLGHYIVKNR